MIGEFIRDHNAIPSFLNYNGYPFNSCISVNDVVVHGFPNKNELKEGDIVSVDIGVIKMVSWRSCIYICDWRSRK